MQKEITINGKRISYSDIGQGHTIVLLHGYLETKEVWTSFAKELSNKFRVIAPDIPGHGQSDTIDETHTMELMAQHINALLFELNIRNITLVGHSMGGYVMLAFAQLFPEKLKNMVLFHSSVYADTDEKKINRQREIEFIKSGKLELIVNTNLPNTFANDNVEKFNSALNQLKANAKNHDTDGVCALLRGMMQREDRQELISGFNKPMLFIFGKKDNYIPIEAGEKMMELNNNIEVLWLEKSGHMGFIEEEKITVKHISDFA